MFGSSSISAKRRPIDLPDDLDQIFSYMYSRQGSVALLVVDHVELLSGSNTVATIAADTLNSGLYAYCEPLPDSDLQGKVFISGVFGLLNNYSTTPLTTTAKVNKVRIVLEKAVNPSFEYPSGDWLGPESWSQLEHTAYSGRIPVVNLSSAFDYVYNNSTYRTIAVSTSWLNVSGTKTTTGSKAFIEYQLPAA